MAQTEKDLRQGLMNIRNLPKNKGMLFVLRDSPHATMWMKNTYIFLDMLFLDCSFRIVDMHENAKPLSLDEIGSSKAFCYVLEINGGEVQNHNLKIGDKIFIGANL